MPNLKTEKAELWAATLQFEISPALDEETDNRTGSRIGEIASPLKTTLLLLEDGASRVCLITTHFGPTTPVNVSDLFRDAVARELDLPKSNVLFFTSHNHSSAVFASNGVRIYDSYNSELPEAELLPIGEEFLTELKSHAKRLPDLLQAVTVWWAEGEESRITYNRKGRRDDGTSYFIREEDRIELGPDFVGDIDRQAPLVLFKNVNGDPVAALAQFTGHPVTSFQPEEPVVFGDWPQVACDDLAEYFGKQESVPVGFLQGCTADVNSKEMFTGGVKRATEFGHMLGKTYIDTAEKLQSSRRGGMSFAIENVKVPLAPLPEREVLISELKEMDDFIQRAESGDENTLACVGLNFPKALSPLYRARLVDLVRSWNVWALDLCENGKADSIAKYLDLEIAVIRVGDVGIVGLPCEPFQGIGRQIRSGSTLPMSIPCGYMNVSHGYITDGPNTGDQEYMSAFYRYTKFRPPLKEPAGDVLADAAVKLLNRFEKEADEHE